MTHAFNAADTYAHHLEHLKRLAAHHGWKAYAWHRAKALAADPSGLWAGIDRELVAAMATARPEPERKDTLEGKSTNRGEVPNPLQLHHRMG